MMNKKAMAMIMIMAAITCAATGCGRKNIAGELDQLDTDNQLGEEVNELDTLAEKLGVPKDGLDYTVDLGQFRYTVKADVEVSAPEKVAVYQEEITQLTEEKVTALAKELFDAGNYEAIKPYAACSLSELEQSRQDIETQAALAQFQYAEEEWIYQDKLADVDFYINHYIEPKTTFEEGKYYDCQYAEAAKTDETLSGFMLYFDRIMILEGKIDGDIYQLVAFQQDAEYGDKTDSFLMLYRADENWRQSDSMTNGYYYGEDQAFMRETENKCTYSEEEAGRLAKDVMSRLGFDEMEIVRTEILCFQRTPIENDNAEEYGPELVSDGYVFYLQRTYQGLSGMYIPVGWEWLTTDGVSYAEQECYTVSVSSEGVISLSTGVLYENTEQLTDDVELLSFDQIDKLAQDAIKAKMGIQENTDSENEEDSVTEQSAYSGSVAISAVALKYLNLQYDGKFTLMPVWVYCSKGDGTGYSSKLYPQVMINAVDGSIIKENEDVIKCIN